MITKENIITNKTPHFEKQGELDTLELELSKAFDRVNEQLKTLPKEVHEQVKRN